MFVGDEGDFLRGEVSAGLEVLGDGPAASVAGLVRAVVLELVGVELRDLLVAVFLVDLLHVLAEVERVDLLEVVLLHLVLEEELYLEARE